MDHSKTRREPAVAGQFYPAAPEQLQALLGDCIPDAPDKKPEGSVRALIVPHAGYQYSGRTAGEGYALLRERPEIERALVLAPSHRIPFSGVSVGGYKSFGTPLGDIPVDSAACAELRDANPLFSARSDAHQFEHSLEVHLPFLQTVLGDGFRLIPAVCGQMSEEEEGSVAHTLAQFLWRPDTVWIVSSDFTHYGPSFGYTPFRDSVPKRLSELDHGAVEQIGHLDPAEFRRYIQDTGATICGSTPIAILLQALQEVDEELSCTLLKYTTSGELTGDYSHSVSYASLAVTAAAEVGGANESAGAPGFSLAARDKDVLLHLARDSISSGLASEPMPGPEGDKLSDALCRDACAFVTLHIGGRLRGCIGSLEPREPLYQNVIRNARSAAFRDPRFRPLTPEEFVGIDIEISVLTPARPIADPEEFIPGRHGVILKKGRARSVFLPQVAPEQGWDRKETLTHLALKAGLGPDDWRRGAKFEVFEAIVFGEKER